MCNGRILEVYVVLKFSTTPLVSGEIHLFIRWSAYTLGVQVKREGSLTRTPPPPPPSVSSRRAAGCGNEPMAIFLLLRKNESFAYAYRVFRAALYIVVCCVAPTHRTNLGFATPPRALRRHRSLLHPERRRLGEQVSGTSRLCDPVRERAN